MEKVNICGDCKNCVATKSFTSYNDRKTNALIKIENQVNFCLLANTVFELVHECSKFEQNQ